MNEILQNIVITILIIVTLNFWITLQRHHKALQWFSKHVRMDATSKTGPAPEDLGDLLK